MRSEGLDVCVEGKNIPTEEELLEVIKEVLSSNLEEEVLERFDVNSIELTTPILRLPLDSASIMMLVSQLEDRMRVYIPDSKAFGFERISDITTFIRERIAAKESR